MRRFESTLVTGAAGFVGSNLVRMMLAPGSGFDGRIVALDSLEYPGSEENLADLGAELSGHDAADAAGASGARFVFIEADVRDREVITRAFADFGVDSVCHLAAESHVDRSLVDPARCVDVNVDGTLALLEAARVAWGRNPDGDRLFHFVGTDEVFGSADGGGSFAEGARFDPSSPYSASKAAAELLAFAWHRSFGLPVTATRSGNNYGPYQHPEKLIPKAILSALERKPMPLYGDGLHEREWLRVDDHASAIMAVMLRGRLGQAYNVGSGERVANLALVRTLVSLVAEERGDDPSPYLDRIEYVDDRPAHDRRYAIDCSKIRSELGWAPATGLEEGLRATVAWYTKRQAWLERARDRAPTTRASGSHARGGSDPSSHRAGSQDGRFGRR